MIRRDTIYTYGGGTPIEGRPEPLVESAALDERLAHDRAWYAYSDRVEDVANKSFTEHFKKAVGAS